MDPKLLKVILEDMKTYFLMNNNENYKARLREAYDYIKAQGIVSAEQFGETEGLKIGAFTYGEMTIFDRLQDKAYESFLYDAIRIKDRYTEYAKNSTYGDQLASWGTLGSTPYREQMISSVPMVEGLTPDEQRRHWGGQG